jgi:hypothetical protein
MIERSPGIPESGKVLIECHINSEGKVFTTKEFQSCLRTNITKIVFPVPPSRNPVYLEHTFLFKKGDKK